MLNGCVFQWNTIKLYLSADEEFLVGVSFSQPEAVIWQDNTVLLRCKKQLKEYFSGNRREFDIPIRMQGTAFQQLIWKKLLDIPYSKTISYGSLAKEVGNPKAARAVGMACNKNPIAIIIPCHRVVGKNGKLIGYAGGVNLKSFLLEIEKRA